MVKKKEKKALQEKAQMSVLALNWKIVELGENAEKLNETLKNVQEHFDKIRNVPSEYSVKYNHAKEVRLDWIKHTEKIEKEYNNACKGGIGGGSAGIGVGVAVAALGPTAAMGVATTFGVASTGTAISSLSGAAATNAALAWLGGGALAAGGGGMAAGNALLALAGPVGWAIAGVGLLASGITLIVVKQDQIRLENTFAQINKRDIKSHERAIAEINERVKRANEERIMLEEGLHKLEGYGFDYSAMTEEQQYELGVYVNLMSASTALLTEPILDLQPKYFDSDFDKYLSIMYRDGYPDEYEKNKDVIVYLANLLYKIKADEKDLELIGKSMKSNKNFLKALKINKKEFDVDYLRVARDAVQFKYVQ